VADSAYDSSLLLALRFPINKRGQVFRNDFGLKSFFVEILENKKKVKKVTSGNLQ